MHDNSIAIIPNFSTAIECEDLKTEYDNPNLYRKTVVMERYRFGLGEYKYFNYPLPVLIQQIRTEIYPHLVSIANLWFKTLNFEQLTFWSENVPMTLTGTKAQIFQSIIQGSLIQDQYFQYISSVAKLKNLTKEIVDSAKTLPNLREDTLKPW